MMLAHCVCIFHVKYYWNDASTNQMAILAGLEDCSECKLYPFISAYQFHKFKFFIPNKLISSLLIKQLS